MNMKLDLKNLDMKKLLPLLRQWLPYIFGVAMIGVFGYTAWVVNAALNAQPGTDTTTTAKPAAKIIFDKKTVEMVRNLDVVQGNVPVGDLGKDDPFR
jgi:hypothetical protein